VPATRKISAVDSTERAADPDRASRQQQHDREGGARTRPRRCDLARDPLRNDSCRMRRRTGGTVRWAMVVTFLATLVLSINQMDRIAENRMAENRRPS